MDNICKYYTPRDIAKRCIDKTFELIPDISEVIEPSAGDGSFSDQIENCLAYDILPEKDYIIQQDFFTLELEYLPGRLFIGNPPFGIRNTLAVRFYKRAIQFGDYVAFILPVSQYNNNYQLYEFDLIHSEVLPLVEYSGKKLVTCFNIYKRPLNGINQNPPDFR